MFIMFESCLYYTYEAEKERMYELFYEICLIYSYAEEKYKLI